MSSDILDLAEYRKKKSLNKDLARDRTPLYVSHLSGKIIGSKDPPKEDFGDRLMRIRSSLDKINKLMAELKHSANLEREIT